MLPFALIRKFGDTSTLTLSMPVLRQRVAGQHLPAVGEPLGQRDFQALVALHDVRIVGDQRRVRRRECAGRSRRCRRRPCRRRRRCPDRPRSSASSRTALSRVRRRLQVLLTPIGVDRAQLDVRPSARDRRRSCTRRCTGRLKFGSIDVRIAPLTTTALTTGVPVCSPSWNL